MLFVNSKQNTVNAKGGECLKTVALTNQKGGVSKTTTAYALAIGLCNRGRRVLIIDADPQSNLSFWLGADLAGMENALYDAFKGDCRAVDALQTVRVNCDLLTVGLSGTAADMELSRDVEAVYMVSEAIGDLDTEYDYVILDTPPNLGLLTTSALAAADFVVIPMNADIYSLQGATQLRGTIEKMQNFRRKHLNAELTVAGLLITKYHEKQNITEAMKSAIEKAAATLNTKVFDTKIRESVAIKEIQYMRGDLFGGTGKVAAVQDYDNFVDEFLKEVER